MSMISSQTPLRAEPKPVGGRRPNAGADIFLSPRVVDARSFEEYAGLLRELIARASDEQENLLAALERGQSLRGTVETAVQELRQGLEQTLRGAQALDDRLSKSERVFERAEALEATLHQLHESSDQHLSSKIDELQRRADATLGDAQERLGHIALERASKISDMEEAIEHRLAVGQKRAEDLEAKFDAQLDQLEGDRADKFVRLIDAIEMRLDEAQGRLTEFDIGLEERLAGAADVAERVFARVDQRQTTRLDPGQTDPGAARLETLERMLERLMQRVEKLEAQADR